MSGQEDIVDMEIGLGEDAKKLAYTYLLKGVGKHVPSKPVSNITHIIVREADTNDGSIPDWVIVEFYNDADLHFYYDFEITCCGHGGQPINLDEFRKEHGNPE
jgi:hypothetical protein